jgi:hypothetical protein
MRTRGSGAPLRNRTNSSPQDVKNWIHHQDALRPFGVGWPLNERITLELQRMGFAKVTMEQVVPHPVFVYRGCVGTSGCASEADFDTVIRQLATSLCFRRSDALSTCSRARFQLFVCLAKERA